jgi:hypothetical protein
MKVYLSKKIYVDLAKSEICFRYEKKDVCEPINLTLLRRFLEFLETYLEEEKEAVEEGLEESESIEWTEG